MGFWDSGKIGGNRYWLLSLGLKLSENECTPSRRDSFIYPLFLDLSSLRGNHRKELQQIATLQ